MPQLTRRLIIHGRVQGVGFRWALRAQATRLGLAGWVRNRRDGSVEALVSGELTAVEAITDWAGQGPTGARVERVLTQDDPPGSVPDLSPGFALRPSC